MGRTLEPEDIIAHYKVIGPLGAGGMGEVYLAHDTKLERDVALKVLPTELVQSEDRVRRFILEAKSASSLSHPHIVAIYEIGHHPVQSAGETEPGGDDVHYIAMELIRGKTVHDLIHGEKIDLKTMLGHLAQSAEGLSKAHAAGIVHRDLKPGNIMVTDDGYAKVLDFGLAKLTEKAVTDDDLSAAPTKVASTTASVVVGTVGYMSPEQVKGKKVDHQSDVFSFGCILYEAATRSRPFAAESKFDTLHKIVHDSPVPIDEINAEVPAELRRVIKRCLTKNPEQRLQSIKDLAIELREIVEEFDTLSATATSASGIAQLAPAPRRSAGMTAGIVAVVALGIAGIAFGIWSMRGGGGAGPAEAHPFQSVQMQSLMDDTNLFGATLSGDSRYLAYIKGPVGQWSLWVRQVATGSDVEILAAQSILIRGVGFSPDGNYLYYLGSDPEVQTYSALFEVPSLGGAPRKRIFDIDTAVTFSPDGSSVAFVRRVPQDNEDHLLVADLATDEQEVLARVEAPEQLHLTQPAWSPDGERIVAVWHNAGEGTRHALVAFDATTGSREFVSEPAPPSFSSMAWLPDGGGLVASTALAGGQPFQVFFIPYPQGAAAQITNDLDGYGDVSVSGDGASLATVRTSRDSSLWVAELGRPGEARQLTSRSSKDSMGNLRSLADGSVLFGANRDRQRHFFRMNADGSGRLPITSQAGWSWAPSILPDDRTLIFVHRSEVDSSQHIWQVDLQGGNPRRVTDGTGENLAAVSPDGRTLLYAHQGSPEDIWRLSLDGGEPERFLEGRFGGEVYSPDGKHVVYTREQEVGDRVRTLRVVVPAAGGEPIAEILLAGDASSVEWAADSDGLTYVHTAGGAQNLWRQPLDGSPPAQLTRFPEGRITDKEQSPDGSRIFLRRIVNGRQNVWTVSADGTGATQATDFRDGEIFEIEWSRDSGSLLVIHGDVRREVVLLADSGS